MYYTLIFIAGALCGVLVMALLTAGRMEDLESENLRLIVEI